MSTTFHALVRFVAPCLALVALGSGCAVASEVVPEAREKVGTVTSGTLTVDDGPDAGALPELPSPVLADDGGTFEVAPIDAGGGDPGRDPVGN